MNKPVIKKVPMRKCVLSGVQAPKKDMFRVVRTPEGTVVVDLTGKTRGHGVYLTKDKDVIATAKKKHLLDKYLEVHVEDEIYDELLKELELNA